MKKLFAVALLVIVAVSFCVMPLACAEPIGSSAYDYMAEFVTKYEKRGEDTSCTEYLVDKLQGFGFEPFYESGYTDDFDFRYSSSVTYFSKNVAAVKKGTSSQNSVIIGAGYDNVAGWTNSVSAVGAYSNGSGIGVLLALAEKLSTQTFDYDIVFVCYGAEQLGCYGSETFVKRLSGAQYESIILYINLDSIGAGDNLYMYCDESERLHETFFKNVSSEVGAAITANPSDKKVIAMQSNVTGLPYTHAMLDSALAYYYARGINCLGFKSFNWDLEFIGYYRESASHKNIASTNKDNLDTLKEYYGGSVETKMNDVVNIVSAGLSKDNFVQTMKDSANNYKRLNYSYWRIIYAVVIGLIAVVIIILLILKGNSGSTNGNNTVKQEETVKDKEENVFDEFGI